jgi:hypothetical protein
MFHDPRYCGQPGRKGPWIIYPSKRRVQDEVATVRDERMTIVTTA